MSPKTKIVIRFFLAMAMVTATFFPTSAQDGAWEAITGAETLRELMSGRTTYLARRWPGRSIWPMAPEGSMSRAAITCLI